MKREPSSREGFTLIELLMVLLLVAIIVLFGLPALQQMIHRSKIEQFCRATGLRMQSMRFESIRRSRVTVLRLDFVDRELRSFVDTDSDTNHDPEEQVLWIEQLPAGVFFSAPEGEQVIRGFDSDANGGWVIFNPDGSVVRQGALRFGDLRSNYLEVKVEPRGTARIEIRKWDGAEWRSKGELGRPWRWN